MKTLTQYIRESIDLYNFEWKMNLFFTKDEIQRSLFNALLIDNDIEKAIRDEFDIKGFVNFMYDDVKPSLEKDYIYQLQKILAIMKSRNYTTI